MNSLPDGQRPRSDDPDFWTVWSDVGIGEAGNTGAVNRSVDWKTIANDWQQLPVSAGTDEQESDADE
ncbi:MAG TPA: hypothetical protein PKG49_08895 [Nitrosomonas mobilis]|nr:hypothetical protein [Nitrosomonas mobilis]